MLTKYKVINNQKQFFPLLRDFLLLFIASGLESTKVRIDSLQKNYKCYFQYD